jgi:carboxyl-terminal processing protease
LTTARFTTPTGRQIQGKGLKPDLAATPVKLEKLVQGDRRREADLRGALKNTDPIAPSSKPPAGGPPDATATPPVPEAPSVATSDIGTAGDEQLSQAVDVLHGLALVSGRAMR